MKKKKRNKEGAAAFSFPVNVQPVYVYPRCSQAGTGDSEDSVTTKFICHQ